MLKANLDDFFWKVCKVECPGECVVSVYIFQIKVKGNDILITIETQATLGFKVRVVTIFISKIDFVFNPVEENLHSGLLRKKHRVEPSEVLVSAEKEYYVKHFFGFELIYEK